MLFIFLFLMSFFNTSSKKIKIAYCLIMAIILSSVSALRWNIGLDYKSYELQYSYISEKKNFIDAIKYYYFEPGFNLINYLARFTSYKFQFVIVISSIFTIVGMVYWIFKYSENVFLSSYLYFCLGLYFASFCWIRQYLALSISLFALNKIKDNKPIQAFLIVLLASCFHYSALCLLPMCLFGKISFNFKSTISLISIAILVVILWDKIVSYALKIFPKFSTYIGTIHMSGKNINSLILVSLLMLLFWVYKKQLVFDDKTNVIYVNAMFLAFIISLFQLKLELVDRFPPFYISYAILGIPAIEHSYKNDNKIIFRCLVVMFGLVWFVYTLYNNYSGVVPYTSILDKR